MTLPGQLTVEKLLTALDQRLAVWSRPTYALVVLATTLGLSLFFFCPRLCLLLGPPYPGTFEWDRGLNFLAQSQDPFHAQVEPALRWRLAPPLAAHILQLRGYWPFIVPWIGLAAMLLYGLHLAGRYFQNRLDAALFSLFTGTLAAVSSVTMAHGINDGWLMLAMLASTFARHPSGRLAGALLGPWVDERYLLCLPLCLACRHILTPKPVAPGSMLKDSRWEIIGILPYVATRLVLTAGHGDAVSSTFLTNALAITPLYLPNTHLGWWMGLRAGWLLVAIAVWAAWRRHGAAAPRWLLLTTLAGFGTVTLLAADLTRTTNFFTPLVYTGAFLLGEIVGPRRRVWLLGLLAANLLLPFAMMTYIWILPTHTLPFELLRLYKN